MAGFRLRILLVQRSLDPPGGGNAVAAWMLQALSGVHDLATLTLAPWHPALVDSYYGTSLVGTSIRQLHPPWVWQALDSVPAELIRLRMAILLRRSQQVERDFDLLVTADNYAAFGRPGVQYLHYPAALRPAPARFAPAVHAYYRLCDWLSGLSWESARLNATLANSQWTARLLQRERGLTARVLYPPVVDAGSGLPWAARANTFLCVGRFNGAKRFELAISVLARVREWLPDLRLRIVGSDVDRDYTTRLRMTVRRYSNWVALDEDLTQAQLLDLMTRSRYGIHAMAEEHFGMAVAEMARAGCLVFAHDSGGQVEAVGGVPELLWRTEDDAVSRIRAVVQSASPTQQELSSRLRLHATQFSRERFVREFRGIVDDYGRAIALNRGSRSNSS